MGRLTLTATSLPHRRDVKMSKRLQQDMRAHKYRWRAIGCTAVLLLGLSLSKPDEVKVAYVEPMPRQVIQVEVPAQEQAKREVEEVSRSKYNSRTMVLEVSAYNPSDPSQCSGTGLAYDGRPAIPGRTIAVDPEYIPLGSKIQVPGYGTFIAHDTGSYIKGNRVDLALATNAECFKLGRRDIVCEVEIPVEEYKKVW